LAASPGIGQQLEDAILDLILDLMSEAAEIISPQIANFFESGDQMRPTSSFLTKLNEEYAGPVVPIGEREEQ
jgi:hypothetical protein